MEAWTLDFMSQTVTDETGVVTVPLHLSNGMASWSVSYPSDDTCRSRLKLKLGNLTDYCLANNYRPNAYTCTIQTNNH
jgi:hypothetical protein